MWVGFSDSRDCAHSEIIKRIRDKSLIEFCSITGSGDLELKCRIIDEVVASDPDAMFGRYDKKVFCPEGLIDRELYSLFADFEGETLRMMDRLHGRGPEYRFRDTFDSRRKFFFDHCTFWYEYLQSRKISHVVFLAVPHQVFDFVLLKIAKRLSIPTIVFSPEKAGKPREIEEIKWVKTHKGNMNDSTFFVSEDVDDIGVWQLSTQIKSIAESKSIPLAHGEFLSEQLWNFNFSEPPMLRVPKRLHALTTMWKSFMRIPKKKPMEILGFVSNSFRSYKQFSRHLGVSLKVENEKKYVLFALAYQPEESTSPRANIFAEQSLAIRALSEVVPDNWQIRVREHPDQYGRRRPRAKEFWDEIEKIPNVVRQPLNVSAFDSLVNAEAMAGPSGTMCVEAWLRGIPVILFGSMFLKAAPGVFLIEKFSDLDQALETILSDFKFDWNAVTGYRLWLNSHSYIGNIAKDRCMDQTLREMTAHNVVSILTSWLSMTDHKNY